jgi:hypothetical protein
LISFTSFHSSFHSSFYFHSSFLFQKIGKKMKASLTDLHESRLKSGVDQIVAWLDEATCSRRRPNDLTASFGDDAFDDGCDMPGGIVELKVVGKEPFMQQQVTRTSLHLY